MNGKTKSRKLSLHKETIRTLASTDLRRVAGGLSGDRCDLSNLCDQSGSIGSIDGNWDTASGTAGCIKR